MEQHFTQCSRSTLCFHRFNTNVFASYFFPFQIHQQKKAFTLICFDFSFSSLSARSNWEMVGIDLLTCPLVQILIACAATFTIFIVSFLRLYCFLTLGKCKSRAKMNDKTVLITGAYILFIFMVFIQFRKKFMLGLSNDIFTSYFQLNIQKWNKI